MPVLPRTPRRHPRLATLAVAAAMLALLAPGLLHAQAPTEGLLRGRVTDLNGEPLVGANVVLLGQDRGAVADMDGIYTIAKLEPGTYRLRAQYFGFEDFVENIAVEAGQPTLLNIQMQESAEDTVLIEGDAFGEIDRRLPDMGKQTFTPKQIEDLPSLGTPDLAVKLQTAAGVVFTGDQGGQIFIRGGTPVMNLTLLDGAIIYNPFHSIGIFSIFSTDYLRSTDLYTGGFSAEYGGRISSVLDVKTRNGNFQRFAGQVHANPITAGATIEGPLGKPKDGGSAPASFLFSARHAFLDQTSKALYSYVDDTLGIPFNFTDLYGKISIGATGNQIQLFGFHQQDNVNYTSPIDYTWRQSGGGALFSLVPGFAPVLMKAGFSYSQFENNQQDTETAFPRYSFLGGFNGYLNMAYTFSDRTKLDFGFQVRGFTDSLSFANSTNTLATNRTSNTEIAAYITLRETFVRKAKPGEMASLADRSWAVLEPGIRFHYYNAEGFFSVEPRLRGKLNFNRFSITAAAGLYAQNLTSAVSDRDVVVLFQGYLAAPPAARDRQRDDPMQHAWHALLGAEIEALPNLDLKVEGWYKGFLQLTNVNREKLQPTDPNFITETGEAMGVDLTAEYRATNLARANDQLYLYFTYSLGRVERTIPAGTTSSNEERPAQTYAPVWDRRHNVNLIGTYDLGMLRDRDTKRDLQPKWSFSLRWTFGSGLPFTQTLGYFEKLPFADNGAQTNLGNANGQLGLLLNPQLNTGRLPAYHRLDVSAKRRFRLGRRQVLEASLNLLNVYDRGNLFYIDRLSGQRVNQFPVLPTVGLEYTF